MELASVCLRISKRGLVGARLGRTVSVCLRGALNADFTGRDWMEIASVCLRGELGADFAG